MYRLLIKKAPSVEMIEGVKHCSHHSGRGGLAIHLPFSVFFLCVFSVGRQLPLLCSGLQVSR